MADINSEEDEKREKLYDWIRNMDEEALDSLIEEYLSND